MIQRIKKPFLVLMSLFLILIIVISGCGGSKKKGSDPEIPVQVAPTAPGTITVVAADSQLAASWGAVTDATLYQVYYSTKEDVTFAEQIAVVSSANCVLSGLTNGTTYFIWVKAQNGMGTSDYSPVGSGTPAKAVTAPNAPFLLTLTPSTDSITVSWEAVEGATAYEVWYGTEDNSGTASKYGDDVTDTLTYAISGLEEGKTYFVWLKAKNSAGVSAFSMSQSTITAGGGSITGLVNSAANANYTVTLVETQNTLSYSNSAYFSFQNLIPGTYHVRCEREGYVSAIKEVTLTPTEKTVNLGTLNLNTTLPTGSGATPLYNTWTNYTSSGTFSPSPTSFTVPYSQTITFRYKFLVNSSGRAITLSLGNIWSSSVQAGGSIENTVQLSAPAGTYTVTGSENIISSSYKGSNFEITYYSDNMAPEILITKTWGYATQSDQTTINCKDSGSGLSSVQYAITNSLASPSNWTPIPANTAIQFTNPGVWYLHVYARDVIGNSYQRVEGPYIIR
jgi:hypothetical protein